MTRKQLYTMLAAALYKAAPSTPPTAAHGPSPMLVAQHRRDVFHIAEELKRTHKSFDVNQFYRDCGVPP